jgi:hypothetical protein
MGSFEKKKALQNGAAMKIGGAFGLGGLAYFLAVVAHDSSFAMVALPMILAAVVLYYWGLGQYCISKGYSGILAVAGILGLIGIIIILVMPDKYQVEAPPVMQGSYPRQAPGSVTTII